MVTDLFLRFAAGFVAGYYVTIHIKAAIASAF